MNLSIEVKFVLAILLLVGVTLLRIEVIERGKMDLKAGNQEMADARANVNVGRFQ